MRNPPAVSGASESPPRHRNEAARWGRRFLPWSGIILLVFTWDLAVRHSPHTLLPTPWAVVLGLWDLARSGLLVKHVVASLFRVTWGYCLAVLIGIPLGLFLGWYRRGQRAIEPLIQVFRPISPLAWIPIAILWCGVDDLAAVFIIFIASVWPITLSTLNAVRNVPLVHLRAARNFGLTPAQTLWRVVLPAIAGRLVTGLRLALGIAWLVDVAAEMIAVNSGLGFLIIDSRNAGNRYDLVVAGMVLIGAVGFVLDGVMRSLERGDDAPRAARSTSQSHLERRRFVR